MCNACGFHCCASDGFDRCGCDWCGNPACWDNDEEDYDTEDGYEAEQGGSKSMKCEAIIPRDARRVPEHKRICGQPGERMTITGYLTHTDMVLCPKHLQTLKDQGFTVQRAATVAS